MSSSLNGDLLLAFIRICGEGLDDFVHCGVLKCCANRVVCEGFIYLLLKCLFFWAEYLFNQGFPWFLRFFPFFFLPLCILLDGKLLKMFPLNKKNRKI